MILCCGENVIDFIPKNSKNYYFKACIGGSPLNTALALSRLNQSVYFFSRISNDFFGKSRKIITVMFRSENLPSQQRCQKNHIHQYEKIQTINKPLVVHSISGSFWTMINTFNYLDKE